MQRKNIINTANVLATLPREAYETFLCPKSIAKLSVCSSTFYSKHKIKPKNENYWKNAILSSISINTRIDTTALSVVLNRGIITNYRALYEGLTRAMPHVFYFRISDPAGFICLCGDPNDLANGFKNNLLSAHPIYRGGLTYLTAMGGNLEGVKYLTVNHNVRFRDRFGNTLLHEVASWNNLDMARFFCLQKNISIEVRNGNRQTPLHIAAQNGYLAMTRLLVNECKANIEAKDEDNRTPLHHAIRSGHVPTARFLVEECKTSLTVKDKGKVTTLHFAVWSGSLEMVRYVFSLCPNLVNSKDNRGKTPASCAVFHPNYDMVRFLVLEGKSSIESTDNEKNTLLHAAAMNNDAKITSMLIHECKANLFAKNKSGRRPVDYTYSKTRCDLVRVFFNAGFKPDKKALDYAKKIKEMNTGFLEYLDIQKMYEEYLAELKPSENIHKETAYHESSAICSIL